MRRTIALIGLITVFTSSSLFALDVGSPLKWEDYGRSEVGVEMLYENYTRALDFTSKSQGQQVGFEDEIGADIVAARLSILGDSTRTSFEFGGFEDEDAAETPVFLGAGLHLLIGESGAARFWGIAAIRYVFEYDAESGTDATDDGEVFQTEGSLSLFEGCAGMMISVGKLDEHNTGWLPYAGLVASFTSLDYSGNFRFADGYTVKSEVSANEDQFLVPIVGLTAKLSPTISARLEGRLIGEESVSASVGYFF